MPGPGQLALLLCSILLFAIGGGISFARWWVDQPKLRLPAKICMYLGICLAIGVLVWHAIDTRNWLPLEDNFDALIWMGLLLALFVAYVQRRKPLAGLDWFVMPIVVLLLACAAVFGRATPHDYTETTWSWLHRVTAYGGAVAFAIACATGAMYLLANRRLRSKTPAAGPNLGSLERLEHLTYTSVTIGFALLTIGLITGLIKILRDGGATRLGEDWLASPKVLLAFGVWVVYALVLHSPINPSFRGRKTAMLSIFGFVLMIGTLVAVQFMPEGR